MPTSRFISHLRLVANHEARPFGLFTSHQSYYYPTATFQTGLTTDHDDYALLGFHPASGHGGDVLESSYLQVNNVSQFSRHIGSENVDTQSPFSTHSKDFGWQDQSGVAGFNSDLSSEMLTHEDRVNTVFPPPQGHISNSPLQPSLLVDVYPMMGQVPEPPFNWEQGSGQFIETTPVPVVTNSIRHTIRSSISKEFVIQPEGDLRCEWRGCPSSRSFGRLADLKRHVETFHIARTTYRCAKEGCMRTFKRKDKFKEHIRKSH